MHQSYQQPAAPRLNQLCLNQLPLALLACGLAGGAATAQTQNSIGQVQDVVVTTGVRGEQRTVADSPAPIDVINGEQLAHTGRAELSEALARLLPSFNFGTNQAGVNSVVRPVSNRGMGPAYTLVLVNGKRRHNAALLTNGGGDTSGVNPVDLDTIPLGAIDHIEVLKDSAAAQYGSDAVAGVVNVILKNGDHGGSAAVGSGRLKEGDGNLNNSKIEADAGFKLGQDGFVHIAANARQRGQSWNNFKSTNPVNYSPAGNPKNASWNRDGARNGDPGIEAYNVAFNAELPYSGDVTLYAFGTAGTRNSIAGNNFRRANGLATLGQLFPDGYFAENNMSAYDFQLNAGARGKSAGWHWDVSTGYGKNRARQYSNLTSNPSLGPSSPTRFDNLATYQFEQWTTNQDVTRAFDIGLNKPLQWSFGAEQRLERFTTYTGQALGYINGGYIFQPGDQEGNPNLGKPAAVGAQAGVALSPADATRVPRTVLALYNDIGFYPTENWFADVAVRAEHYNDSAGNTVSGKFNSRYDITPRFALRGTVGSGFRAPSLTQLGYAQTDNRTNINPVTGEVAPSLSKLLRNDSTLARQFGAQDLTPEKSTNFGLGLVFKASDATNITLDAYQVAVKDRIVRTGYMFGPAFAPLLKAAGLTGTEWVQYFANGVDTRTRGADLVADTSSDYGTAGLVRWGAALNWNRTALTSVKATPAGITALGPNPGGTQVWFGYAASGGIGDLTAAPRTKLILSARWFIGDFDVNLQTTRYDKSTWQTTANRAQDYHFGAKWLTDLDLTYALGKHTRLVVGAANLFNVFPDKNGPGDPNTGSSGFVYGPSPFAPTGAFYYAKASYDF
ncbi:TonB-dependent receptor plug domain-containing protein [Janthinobacterium agaricidamnosum]|uniref:TonB-dependent Receptor Plug domain protein n=1 Tax=Janthinobacterium agaricidamnosum NBRC 102515 = DSM 9628 TaxID=1349767 RepID=W0V427_9BURK|nr:TonB-dependent receptor [Janthinobacterium agaricidamnosum]CDG82360.1 tonB-dependent Receptor Plug domain protein [Janthinobacterium agaricidamnosum NBRC 102515 = DSM 9628]